MKKTIWVIVIVLILLGFWSTNDKEVSISDETLRIGFVGPFSGPVSSIGEFMQSGLNLALDELSEEDRSRVEIIREDDKCLGKDAVNAFKKLIEIDKVNYIIGPLCNESSIATKDLVNDNNVVTLTIGLPSNEVADLGENHFSFSPEIEYMMEAISNEIIDQEIKKVAILRINSSFYDENNLHFNKYFSQSGGEIVINENLAPGTRDFRSSIAKIKNSDAEALLLIGHTAELNSMLTGLRDQNLLNLPKFGIHAAETPVLLQLADLANGFIYPYPADKTQIEENKEYNDRYKNLTGFDADPYSSNVYDSFNILFYAINECGYDNKVCVRDKFSNLENYRGANGLLSVDERGVGQYKEVMLKTVKEGQFVKLD